MKLELKEYAGCFSVHAEAETLEDAALLTRMSINATQQVRSCCAYAHADGKFTGSIVIGKRRNEASEIPKKRGR